ncbi:MAG: prepilin-type N-terminal cleavage/methylation domain-containing protein [Candidatus Omnitrophica bacterium]|nr:prepilin-type N-terminal cleavage/methylation domain-containing protein [Candidatus Omnitrophota bacterium]
MRKQRRSAFTLLELLVIVVIVGILATVALPNFSRSAERAKVHDAQTVLSAIHSAERVYILDQNTYGALADLTTNGYLTEPNPNTDWTFTAVGGAAFTATATRNPGGGVWTGNTIQVNQDFAVDPVTLRGNYGGNHPLRDRG